MTTGHMTYTGMCSVDGTNLLCSSMSSSIDQKVLFFDHIMGLKDTFSNSGTSTGVSKKSSSSTNSTQKKIYRYSPAIAKASISGPVPDRGFQSIVNAAINGSDISVTLVFWASGAANVTLTEAKISNLTITLKAGDIAQYSMEIVSGKYSNGVTSSSPVNCQKLLTWDTCTVDSDISDDDIESFSVTINNPVIPIYTTKWTNDAETGGMMPQKLRIGIQEVSGSIGVYGNPTIDQNAGSITFGLNSFSKTIKVVYVQPKDEGNSGIYIKHVSFYGVNDGAIWS